MNSTYNNPPPLWGTPEKTLLEANDQMRMIAKQQAMTANHQIMMQAQGKLQQKYFDEVHASIIFAATNLEEETRQVELRERKASAEKKIVECHLETEGTGGDIDSENVSFE